MKKFVSLRSKILLGFTIVFTVFSVGVYYWFYRFTTEKTLQRLKDDLQQMAMASSRHIDVKELMELSREGKPTPDGRSNDPRYEHQLQWLIDRNQINPRIFLYTFMKDFSGDEKKIQYLVDVWINIDPSKSAHFLESDLGTSYHLNTLNKGSIKFRDTYKDKWGEWITYYAPIRDESGRIIAGIGADMPIDDIRHLQEEIKRTFLISFSISYPFLLIVIYLFSTILTQRFQAMQKYPREVGEGNYHPEISLSKDLQFNFFSDERIILSKALEEMTEKIRHREELLHGIFNQVAVGIAIFSPDYQFKIVNQTLCHLLGYTTKELLNKDYWSIIYPEDIDITRQYLEEIINTSASSLAPHEKRYLHKNGEIKWCEVAFTIVKNPQGKVKEIITVFRDISRRREAENKLIEAATKDFLTKLPNRRCVIKYLEKILEKSQQEIEYKFALLLIDLDDFKTINDSLGHSVGDQFLINISHHLQQCVGKNDMVARLGGDEFAIVLTSVNSIEEVITVAKNIQTAINSPVTIYHQKLATQFSASIGIVMSNNKDKFPSYVMVSDLLRDADIAMYKAKNKGKKNYQIFGQEMYEDFVNRLKLANELKSAIEEDKLTLYYQPIVNLNTGKLYSLESLVRWNHTELGFLSPSKFLSLAEESSLIIELGNWVLNTACHQLRHWQERGILDKNITINVNVAGKQFETVDLLEKIFYTLEKTKLSPSNLRIEVTETIISQHPNTVTKTLQKIQDLGVKIAIDDFGTGYSSLARLKNFPVNQIKIDKVFVQPLNNHPKDVKFLQGIINLCHNLDLEVVCEGIETQKQKKILSKLKCDYGQGYLFAKPLSVEDFESWILTNNHLNSSNKS